MSKSKQIQNINRSLDPLEVKYAYGYARLMRSAKLSIDGEALASEALTDKLDEILDQCFKAYAASAIKGKPVGFWHDHDRSIRWDFLSSMSTLSNRSNNSNHCSFKAYEDLPRWRETAYEPYLSVVRSMPSLLTRLELITIEDSELKRLTEDDEFRQHMEGRVALFQETLRTDGFMVHGPGMKVTVHHRQTGELVKGLGALKDHLLASSDYTEQYLFNKRSGGGGLAGVDQAEREHTESQTLARLVECWEPVLKLWLDVSGYDSTQVALGWALGVTDRLESAQAEKIVAEAAQINTAIGVLPVAAYSARYQGGEAPSQFPIAAESPEIA